MTDVHPVPYSFGFPTGNGASAPVSLGAMTHENLVRRAQQGDAASREALARRWLGRAYGAALACVRHAADAEDVVQESFYRAFRALERLRDPDRFGPWLLQIVRNAARDHHRRPRRERALGEGEAAAQEARPERGGAALAAWRELPQDLRLVCWLKLMDGLPLRDIAELLGVSKSAAHRMVVKGIARLRRELSRC